MKRKRESTKGQEDKSKKSNVPIVNRQLKPIISTFTSVSFINGHKMDTQGSFCSRISLSKKLNVENAASILINSLAIVVLMKDGIVHEARIKGSSDVKFNINALSQIPVISSLPKIKFIAANNNSTLFIDIAGQVWGKGEVYCLGDIGEVRKSRVHREREYKEKPFVTEPTKVTVFHSLWEAPVLEPPKFTQLAISGNHEVLLDENGNVWSSGMNDQGQLGLADQVFRYHPFLLEGIPKMQFVAVGDTSSFFLDFEGNVWACGDNDRGTLGLGDRFARHHPDKIENLPPIKYISVMKNYALFLDIEGRVWATGCNRRKTISNDDAEILLVPKLVSKDLEITFVETEANGFYLLDNTGLVWARGRAEYYAAGSLIAPKQGAQFMPLTQVFDINTV